MTKRITTLSSYGKIFFYYSFKTIELRSHWTFAFSTIINQFKLRQKVFRVSLDKTIQKFFESVLADSKDLIRLSIILPIYSVLFCNAFFVAFRPSCFDKMEILFHILFYGVATFMSSTVR